MKKRILKSAALVLVIILTVSCLIVPASAYAGGGIKNNGTSGIWIDIYSSPYTDYAAGPWGQYAYGDQGCAWFACSRFTQLTGRNIGTIWDGASWWGYSTCSDLVRDKNISAPALICYSGHIAVLEKWDGSAWIVSEGGDSANSDYFHDYCSIHTATQWQIEHGRGDFLGYVHFASNYSPPELSASWSNLGATNIGEHDARLAGTANFNQYTSVTAAGIRLYNSAGVLVAQKDEGSSVSNSICNVFFDVGSELGVSLSPGTNYSYKLFVTAGGKTFWSDIVYFKTAGTSVPTYTVSYDAAGGSGAPEAQAKTHGQPLTLSSTIPIRAQYRFLHWKNLSTNEIYYPGDYYTDECGATLTAVWVSSSHTVSFDPNGGTGDIMRIKRDYGNELIIPDYVPTREGYCFAGWSESSTASSGKAFPGYFHGWVFNDVTLYATWKVDHGSCGESAEWQISGNTLYITGSGETYDYGWISEEVYNELPWRGVDRLIDTVVVEEGITRIGNELFYSYPKLESVSLPSTLTSIGDLAFCGCNALTEIDIPNSVSRAGREAFEVCTGLTTIVIPEAITELAPYIFSGCDFASVYIHSGVTKISEGAFCNCTIEDLYYTGSADEWSEITIEGNNAGLSFCRMHCGRSCQYEIQYNANGGSGAPVTENKYYGQTYQISDTVPVRPEYRFVGWSENKNAVTAEYQPGDVLIFNRDTVLYAVWSQDCEITVAVSDSFVTVELADAESGSFVFLAQYKGSQMTNVQIKTYNNAQLAFDMTAGYDVAKVMVLDKSYRPLCAPVLIE